MITLLFRSYAAGILGLSGYFATKILRLRRICKLNRLIIRFSTGIEDERAMYTQINQSETFKHFINLDSLELKQVA
jgi:hypothetical protein